MNRMGFLSLDLTDENLFTYFLDNNKTFGHRTVIFGIRELNSTEFEISCIDSSINLLINDDLMHFSSNYELRLYTSGCFYLNSNSQWHSDGLLVSRNK